jgi:hypothetical protein
VALVVGFALVGNLAALHSGSLIFNARAADLRAAIAWLDGHPDSPLIAANVPPTRSTPAGVSDILALASRRGSVTRDDLLPGVVRPPSSAESDHALFGMIRTDFLVRIAGAAVVAPSPPRMSDSHDVTTTPDGGCLAYRVTGPAPDLSVDAPGGATLLFDADASGTLKASLGLSAAPQDSDSISHDVVAGLRYAIAIPDVAAGSPWTLRLDLPLSSPSGRVCSLASMGP